MTQNNRNNCYGSEYLDSITPIIILGIFFLKKHHLTNLINMLLRFNKVKPLAKNIYEKTAAIDSYTTEQEIS